MKRSSARPTRPQGPRPEGGAGRAFLLALLMHVLLFALLFYGMRWQNSSPAGSEAELWTPPELAQPTPTPAPPAPPAPRAVATPTPPAEDADIALQQKKRKQAQEAAERARLLEAQQAQARQEALKQKQLAEEKAADAAKKKAADEAAKQKLAEQKKADALKREQEAQAKKAEQDKLAVQKKAETDKAAKAKAAQDAADKKAADQARQQRLASLRGAAGGAVGATGNGLGSSQGGTGAGAGGTASPGYLDRVRRRVKPNITYTEAITGNPTAIVEVRLAPDGSVIAQHLVQSSGVPSWDQAVQTAVKLSDPLPRDTDGKAPSALKLRFSPKD